MRDSTARLLAALPMLWLVFAGTFAINNYLSARRDGAAEVRTDHADVNTPRYDGLTQLHLAAMHHSAYEVEALLVRGANINTLTPSGHTALDFAISGSKQDVEGLLRSKGARVGCGPPLRRDAWNDIMHFKLYVFPLAAGLLFPVFRVLGQLTQRPVSPLALSYAIPVAAFLALQLRYACSDGVQNTLTFYGIPLVATLCSQALAFCHGKPLLLACTRIFAVVGLLPFLLVYLFLLTLLLSGAH